jgi:hypothetical protein
MTAHWHVRYAGKPLGGVEAPDEKAAIAEAARQFHITPARRVAILVIGMKIDANDGHSSSRALPKFEL